MQGKAETLLEKLKPYWVKTKVWATEAWTFLKNLLRWFFPKAPEQPDIKFWLSRLGKTFLFCLLVFFFFIFLIDINFLWLFGRSPELSELENPSPNLASELYSADGVLLGKYYTENRSPVIYEEISPELVNALIATEDARFYEHAGIDVLALPSVALGVVTGKNRGGSTITQQLAKNLYKTRVEGSTGLLGYIPVVRKLIIKLKEWITAVKLEQRFTKEEIITLYFNTVDFGANAFGIMTAAKTFFNTTPAQITTEQAAVLIGLLKATTYYSPLLHPERSLERRNIVLSQMTKYGYLEETKKDSLSKLPLTLDFTVERHYDGPATYFRGVLNNYLKEWCARNGYDLYRDGLKVHTTINSKLQQYAEEAVTEQMKVLQRRFYRHWEGENPWIDENKKEIPGFIEEAVKQTKYYKYLKGKHCSDTATINKLLNEPKPMTVFSWKGELDTTFSTMDSLRYYKKFLHAGFMVMDPYTGQIRAWVGGINYKYFQYDHVRQMKRQPGSTFKAFLYAAALDNGWGPCDSMTDMPITIRYKEKGKDKTWSPQNSDWVFTNQQMTLRRAMGKSVNSIAAQLTEKIGWDKVVEYAHRLGISSELEAVPSIALGPSDVSIYEMAGAYSTFMNQGMWTEPLFITHITDKNGRLIHSFIPKRKRAISPETAYLMTDMLRAGMEEPVGTSQALFEFDLFRGNEIGGKTGTSSNHSDGWFIGVTKDLVGCSWVGGEDRSIHFRSSALGEGSKTALPIFGRFMEKVYSDKSTGITMGRFPKPAIKISKPYNCRTVLPKIDSTAVDTIPPQVMEMLEKVL